MRLDRGEEGMTNYIEGKSVIITGAGSGFGRLTSEKAAALGASVTCADINLEAAEAVAAGIRAAGGRAQAIAADVRQIEDMKALAKAAVAAHGAIDVMVNNAGTMPLAFMSDHEAALDAWHRCIDINFKGVLNGVIAVYDQMVAQGRGHVINLSSIYGNAPVVGSGVYGATKAAVDYLSHSLRQEGRGKIKVTVVKPTGVPATGLGASVVNVGASLGIMGNFGAAFGEMYAQMKAGNGKPEWTDPESPENCILAPVHIADGIIHAMNQPWGVSISDITVRATGDYYVL
jgi:NADP-dependent 3-hydroxy acid dehydrogenase YdfG